MKRQSIGEAGDLDAPPGSLEHTIAIKYRVQYLLDEIDTSSKTIEPYLSIIEKHKSYRLLTDQNDKPFESPLDLYEAPYPFGFGGHPKIEDRIAKLRPLGTNQYSKNGGSYNYLQKGERGNDYILSRLKRDHPEILADLLEGKYRSARQAGIAAGFVKDRKYIQVAPIPEKIAHKLKERLTPDQIKELIDLLQ